MNHHDISPTEQTDYRISDALGGLPLLNASFATQCFSRHVHEEYTISVVERGVQRFFRSRADHLAPTGQIILVNADDVHTGHAASAGGWSYRAMYPLPEQFAAIGRDLGLGAAMPPYFRQPVVDDPPLAAQLVLVLDTLATHQQQLLRETLVYGFLVNLACRHGRIEAPSVPAARHPRIEQVRAYLDAYPTHDISLQVLAELAELTPYHLVRSFSKQVGLPPHAYQTQLRLKLARQLLRDGVAIVETAHACGFHDQSHLHRHFKRAMGITPGQFVKQYQLPSAQ
ncbi:AraC family transcriptional regulator [Aeromonas cavernicola]|uniref:AraC family transcriptional regulator n=1 Tax=Aeromonas cavernicola TaxID=1006623 RepID=A0A2H9U9Q7_9GAMM|nr:AraC family transcriptional regulator [Aeromonas cavernicola]PJG60752.1 AraC family transcriptional regulator [Aeromonas cavernicola]